MFKLVTQFTDQPVFLMICDHHECGAFASAPVSLSALNPATIPEQELQFLNSAKEGGWLVTMRIQFCPNHHKLLKDRAQSSIVAPNGAPAPAPIDSATRPEGAHGGASFVAE
jgi:hypothetical protein